MINHSVCSSGSQEGVRRMMGEIGRVANFPGYRDVW